MIQVKKLYKCQKAITIKKERKKEGVLDVNFAANKNDVFEAMRDLTPTAFALYMYCISNQENYTFGLSKQDVMSITGIKERSYTTAVQLLIDKEYLVYTGDYATDGTEKAPLYNFYSRPNRM